MVQRSYAVDDGRIIVDFGDLFRVSLKTLTLLGSAMKIFFITDNTQWFKFLNIWRRHRSEEVVIYCSPKGEKLFLEEIDAGEISPLDVKSEAKRLSENFDLGFSCHCKQIFPENLVKKIPCFNFHPGINPHNRGWFPQVFSIINGKPIGATVHKMDEQIDHGPIIAQKEVFIASDDTSKSVYDRVVEAEFELFYKWIDYLIVGEFDEVALDSPGNYNSISDFNKICEIDLGKKVTFKEAIDYFRAMTFDGYDNSFFLDKDGRKIYVSIDLKAE